MGTSEQKSSAQRVRENLAVLQASEDLLRIGAYTAGANPQLDQALHLDAAIKAFLRQKPDEQNSLSQTIERMKQVVGQP